MAPVTALLPVECRPGASGVIDFGRVSALPVRLLCWTTLLMALAVTVAAAQEPARGNAGGFVTVRSPITSATVHSVRRQTDALLNAGARIVVYEVQPGTSDYGNCLNLAQYIESVGGAKTVAYVREPVSGHAVMVALAADELVMGRKAELGDIGRDEKVIRPGMLTEYSELGRRRKPAHRAIIVGMLDKPAQVWKVVTARGTRYALDDELRQLATEEQIQSKEILVMAGQLANFTGDQLRQIGMAQLTAESRAEVAELYGLSPKSAVETADVAGDLRPVLVRIEGEIAPLLKEYVIRRVNEARESGRNFFIFEIDSYGGQLHPGLELAEFIKDMKGVRTVAYVPARAISAAALIALGCDEIIMHPDAKLGDCGVMFEDPESKFQYVPEKELSYVTASLEALAKVKGYPPALARAMVEKDLVVKEVRDNRTGAVSFLTEEELRQRNDEALEVRRTVKDKDRFLTVDGSTAASLNLARDLVDNLDGLKAIYGIEQKDLQIVRPNWVDTLIAVLNHPIASVFLIVVGVLGLYLELKVPGVTLPGIVAGLCFLLFFWSHVMGGTATTLEILLFLAGVLCLGVEILVIPGFGVFGVTGILLVFASLILASQTFVWPGSPSEWRDFTMRSITPLTVALASVVALVTLISRYLPHVPMLGRMVLDPAAWSGRDEAVSPMLSGHELLGAKGEAITPLRPAGLARFGSDYVDVVSDGTFIESGATVQVVEIAGNRVVVKPLS